MRKPDALVFIVAALLPSTAQSAPAMTDAELLGRRLAEHSLLTTLIPIVTAKETDELIADHKNLTPAEVEQLRSAAASTAKFALEQSITVQARVYSSALSLDDLRTLVRFAKSKAAAHQRQVQPQVIVAALGGLQPFDFKKDTWATFCRSNPSHC